MRVILAACREQAVGYNTLPEVVYLIHAPYTRIVVIRHISDIPQMIFVIISPRFV